MKGKPQSQSDCTEGGEANWGMYRPSVGNGGNYVNQPGKNGTVGGFNGTIGPSGGSGSSGSLPGAGNSTIGGGFPNTNSTTGNNATGFGDELSACHAPVDTKYGLPTACVGEYFDLDLDEALGYGELSADDRAFLKEAIGGKSDMYRSYVTQTLTPYLKALMTMCSPVLLVALLCIVAAWSAGSWGASSGSSRRRSLPPLSPRSKLL